MRIRWTRSALANLDDLAAYVADDDPMAAERLVRRIVTAVQALRDQPAMGRPGRVPHTRELVVVGTAYIVPYRVRARAIEILRVFHAARRWPEDFLE
jgi:addiction module RelE/StbE family toxin